MKKLILVDGNSIMFRAYYATAYTGNVMKTSDNLYTNAIYGFVNMMNKILTIEDVTNIFVAFDKGKQTFRHQAYKEYKGGRKPMPEEFSMQIPFIKEYLDILKIKRLETDDYEADDLIGTIAKRFAKTFDEIVIISGDKDLLQLVGNNVKVFLNKKGITDLEEYNETNFKDLMGFEAKQLTDYKGLIGDKSDNLPGISGVGDKTAIKLLNEYQTLENIIANVDKIKGKLSQTIKEEKEIALRTKMLATLELDAKIDIIEEETLLKKPNLMELRNFFEKLEFNSFLKKINFQTLDEKIVEEKLNIDEKKEYYFNDLSKTLDALNHAKTIVIEVELDGENYHKSSIIGLGIIVNQIGFYLDKRYLDNDELKSLLSSDLIVYTIDAKKTYVSLKYLGIDLKHIAFDVVLSAYVVNPSYITSDIKSIVERFIQTKLPYFEEIYGKKTTYVIPDEKTVATNTRSSVSLVLRLKEVIDKKLKENHQIDLFYNIELPLAKILGLVEMNGFKVNENKLKEVGDYFNTLMKKVEKKFLI